MNPEQEYQILLRLIFVGPDNAGKSTLLQVMTNNKLESTCIHAVIMIKYFEIDNMKIKAQIWDSAGEDNKFKSITLSAHYKGTCGIFLAFDLTSEQSFQDIFTSLPFGVPVLLVGCKSDLVERRAVQQETAQALANDLHMQYIETSAKDNSNCKEALEKLCRIGIQYLKQRGEQKKSQPQLNDQIGHKHNVCF